MNVIR